MESLKIGALPTATTNDDLTEARKLELVNHYLNHRGTDIPNGKKNSSNKLVIDSTVHKINRRCKGDSSVNFFEDLKSEAKIIVFEAAKLFISGTEKKENGKQFHINYNKKWDFCKFATKQIEWKLRTYLYHLNTNKFCGKLPDSNKIRKLYVILPKFKKVNKNLVGDDVYKKISNIYGIDFKTIKFVDEFMTNTSVSGDSPLNDDNNTTLFEIIPDDKNPDANPENAAINIQTKNNNDKVIDKFKELQQSFLNNLPERERVILERAKLKKDLTLTELSKKYKISIERTRQIAEKSFEEFELFIKKNKKDLRFI
jgi:hypothetical protein